MSRRAFTLLEVLLALVLIAVGVLGALAVRQHAHRSAQRADTQRRARTAWRDSAEHAAARRDAAWGRSGFTVLEALMALTLAGAVVAVGLIHHGAAARAAQRREAQQTASVRAAEAAEALVADVREWWRPAALGDTAIDGGRVLGGGLSCAPGVLVESPELSWRATPRPGDQWWEWHGTAWVRQELRGIARARCPDGAIGWRGEPLVEPAAPLGTVVRVVRQARWVAYRDADGAWQLGLREANGARWDAVQPAVGPFDALRLHLSAAPPQAAQLRVAARVQGVDREVLRWVHPRNP
jgi:prepilin-type N-terminal cleavage/methylation domain-containing protein